MSPDAAAVERLIDRAVRRARLLLAAEAAAIGAAVAALSIPLGLLVAIAVAFWRAPRAGRRAVVQRLERVQPAAKNLLVTADELSRGTLAAKAPIHDRVMQEAAAVAGSTDVRAAFTPTVLIRSAIVAVVAWLIISAAGVRRHAAGSSATTAGIASPSAPGVGGTAPTVTVDVAPPRYTGLTATHAVDPAQIEAVENSTLHLAIDAAGPSVRVETADGAAVVATRVGSSFEHRMVLRKSGFVLVVSTDGGRRMMPVTVTPDALPSVRLAAPARDLVYSGGNPRIGFEARATDDFGLDTLTLKYTKVSGSGEQFEFKDGEIPLVLAKRTARDWSGVAERSLADLGLRDGDMLVYRAVALDSRPGGGEASSDAFFIEISRLGIAAGDAFTLPEEETRYALSQQMLILKTDRLHQRRETMTRDAFGDASRELAIEQRMIRSEFVFMLGGEIEDEEVEAEQSTELQEGRLANRGQRDLRAATVSMSQAEKFLTGANTAEALKAERAAVFALQRAFARDRYILRALATRSQLDLSRRLTGAVTQPIGWRRVLPELPSNRRVAQLQGLLEGLGEASARARPFEASHDEARAQLALLAELAVRIDPESAPLRRVARDLQRLADVWSTSSPEDRRRGLDAAASEVAKETRAALADPPATVGATR